MRKSEHFEMRIAPSELERLREAAQFADVPVSLIVRHGAMKEAKRILTGSSLPAYASADRDAGRGKS